MTVESWDAEAIKDDPALRALHKQGYRVAGFYLGGPDAATSHLGKGYATRLHAAGFAILPIYVGLQQAKVEGTPAATLSIWGKGSAIEAERLLSKLHQEAPEAVVCAMAIDWEGPLSPEGAVYVKSWLDAIKGKQYLYRTDAGVSTPGRHVWEAHPGINKRQAMKLLHRPVEGVQYDWGKDVDSSVWEDSILPSAAPDPLLPVGRLRRLWKRLGGWHV
jgi:Domain of unknown function (DUF1906)